MSPTVRHAIVAVVAAALVLPAFAGQEPREDQEGANEERAHDSTSDTKRGRAPGRDWGFFIAPYGWLAGTAGTVVTNGDEFAVDASFSDLAQKTRGGFQIYFEARHRKWFLAFDGTWAMLGDEIEGRVLTTDIEVEQRIYDIRAGYEAYWKFLGEPSSDPDVDWRRRAIVDVYVGGRYFRTAPRITITRPIGDPIERSGSDSRVDPFVGLRAGWDMSYRWGMGFKGDIGGFGIGDAAELSWQAAVEIGYRVSKRVVILGGYRWLDFDTITGEGEDRNGQSLLQQGPIIGAGIAF
jgi:hypothetical protein